MARSEPFSPDDGSRLNIKNWYLREDGASILHVV